MAATWTSEITVTNFAQKRICVRATRTDGLDVWTKTFNTQIDPEDVQASKVKLAQEIRNSYLADAATDATHTALLNSWESDLNAWLDGQEA